MSTNDIKMNIISIVAKINDDKKLRKIFQDLTDSFPMNSSADFKEALVVLEDAIPYAQIVKQQGYQPIEFSTYTSAAQEIKWDQGLDDILVMID